jgi:hypothetical protein
LGWALKFYDISLRYAPTPQAKGKVEREHQFWQGRLPSYFASEKITEIEVANRPIDALRAHHNAHEVHRELRQTPQRAWHQAKKENRSVVRPVPRCAWWNYVWRVRTPSRSALMAASPSARSGCAWNDPRAARSCFASILPAIIPCWPQPPIPTKNLCCSSPTTQNNHSCFVNYKTFLF